MNTETTLSMEGRMSERRDNTTRTYFAYATIMRITFCAITVSLVVTICGVLFSLKSWGQGASDNIFERSCIIVSVKTGRPNIVSGRRHSWNRQCIEAIRGSEFVGSPQVTQIECFRCGADPVEIIYNEHDRAWKICLRVYATSEKILSGGTPGRAEYELCGTARVIEKRQD